MDGTFPDGLAEMLLALSFLQAERQAFLRNIIPAYGENPVSGGTTMGKTPHDVRIMHRPQQRSIHLMPLWLLVGARDLRLSIFDPLLFLNPDSEPCTGRASARLFSWPEAEACSMSAQPRYKVPSARKFGKP
jgi:hypothetical protein